MMINAQIKTIVKMFFFVLVLIYLSFVTVIDVFAASISVQNGDSVTYYDTLSDAVLAAPEGSETVFTLLSDVEINTNISIPANKKVVIDGNSMYSLVRGKTDDETWYVGSLFTVQSTGELVLKNVTVDEKNEWIFAQEEYELALENMEKVTDATAFITSDADGPVVTSQTFHNYGILTLENATIKNHFSMKGKGVFYGYAGSTTTLIRSVITHCASSDGSVIAYTTGTDTKFYIEEGTSIHHNYAGGNGGMLKIYGNSLVVMNGGEIKNNSAVNSNGVVSMTYGATSTFILNDGIISNNSGVIGKSNGRNAAIYVHSGSRFIMNGGLIEYNHGQSCGGVDVVGHANAGIELNAGIIQYNETAEQYDYRSDLNVGYDYDLVLGSDMVINGNIQINGDLTNNGIINGDVILNLGDTTNVDDTTALAGTGKINGDVIVYWEGEVPPVVNSDIPVDGEVVPCNTSSQYLVTFDYNDRTDESGKTKKLLAINVDEVPVPPVQTGYVLNWYLDKELTLSWTPAVLSSDLTLYAEWIANTHLVTFDVDGAYTTIEVNYNELIELPSAPVKKGYIFAGWSNYTEGMTMPDKDVVFAALWTEKTTNPGTSDNILVYLFMTLISAYSIVIAIKQIRRINS